MGYGLGVDLGTTFTAAAIERDGHVEMVTLGDRTAAVPSVVLVREDGQVLTGDAADRRATSDPDNVAREVKRRLGDPMPLVLGGSPHSAAELIGLQLRDVVTLVSEREGGMPDAVTLTHPANWGPYRRELFAQVPRTAGLRDVRMITEPEAAAVHYASNERLDDGALVAVYDLGGGTFDATVLRKVDSGFELLGTPEGIEGLGGIDFDEAVLQHVDHSLGGPLGQLDPADPRDTTAAIRLRQECSRAKEALSADTEATIPVVLPGLQTEVRLTRGEFEDMVRPSIGATIESLQRALLSAGVTPNHLTTVLLVGGSSRIPLVSQMVSAELGRPTSVDAHPKHAIVLGAAAMSGRGYADGRGRFIGPPTGAAPVTTMISPGGAAHGPGSASPNSGLIPVVRNAPRPPTGPFPVPGPPRMPPPATGPAGPGTRVPAPALAAAGTPAAGMPAPSLRATATPADGGAGGGGRGRRLALVLAAVMLLVVVVGGGALFYQRVSSATPGVPAPTTEVAPPVTTAPDPVEVTATEQAEPTGAAAPGSAGGGSSGGGADRGGSGGYRGSGSGHTTTTWRTTTTAPTTSHSTSGCCGSGGDSGGTTSGDGSHE